MAYHSGTSFAEYLAPFAPVFAGKALTALRGRNNLATAVDRWEDEGGLVPGTVPVRSQQPSIGSSTSDEAEALVSQIGLVAQTLASDFSEGRVGRYFNTFQHRSRVLRQMRARLEALGERGAASIAREQSQ